MTAWYTLESASFTHAIPPWRRCRQRRSGAARRAQKDRGNARAVQKLLKGFEELSNHRGGKLSYLGHALHTALKESFKKPRDVQPDGFPECDGIPADTGCVPSGGSGIAQTHSKGNLVSPKDTNMPASEVHHVDRQQHEDKEEAEQDKPPQLGTVSDSRGSLDLYCPVPGFTQLSYGPLPLGEQQLAHTAGPEVPESGDGDDKSFHSGESNHGTAIMLSWDELDDFTQQQIPLPD